MLRKLVEVPAEFTAANLNFFTFGTLHTFSFTNADQGNFPCTGHFFKFSATPAKRPCWNKVLL